MITVAAFFCGWCVAGALVCLGKPEDRPLGLVFVIGAVVWGLGWAGVGA